MGVVEFRLDKYSFIAPLTCRSYAGRETKKGGGRGGGEDGSVWYTFALVMKCCMY